MTALIPFIFSLVLWYLAPELGILFFLATPSMAPGVDGDYTAIVAMFFLSVGLWFVRRNRVEEVGNE